MIIYPGNGSLKGAGEDQAQTKHEINSNQQRIVALEKEVADLNNLVEGLWTLLQSNDPLSDDNLRAAIADVIANRKLHRERKRGCKSCARFVSAHYKKCIYCGGDLVGEAAESLF